MVERLTRVPRERKSANPGPAKFYTALQTTHQRFDIYAINLDNFGHADISQKKQSGSIFLS